LIPDASSYPTPQVVGMKEDKSEYYQKRQRDVKALMKAASEKAM
jgi:hypothetical protein